MDPRIAIAPDGSPVPVFRALPAGPAIGYVRAAVEPGASIVDLGCGAGRLLLPLAALGHRVVGVDVCPAMLTGLPGVVCADIGALPLHGTFGGVVLASYLVNSAEGASYLSACRRLVAPGGALVVQRYDPLWATSGVADAATVGNVTVAVRDLSASSGMVSASVRYTLGGTSWDQAISAVLLDDDGFSALAASCGLTLDRWLDEHRTWARLVPVHGGWA